MAKLLFTFLLVATTVCTQAQNVGIGTTSPAASAALEISSNNKGLLIPRTSATGRTAIASPAKGLMLYDSTYGGFYYYDGGRWLSMADKNYDSATIDYSSQPLASHNLPVSTTGFSQIIPDTVNSGYIYDNGGPAGDYTANTYSGVTIFSDDSTLGFKIEVEQMNAEFGYDSLFIITRYDNTEDTLARLTGTQTGTYYEDISRHHGSFTTKTIRIRFKANHINQLSGFKIKWGRIKSGNIIQTTTPPYGWHLDYNKKAAMGGQQLFNNWHTDSVGYISFSYGFGNKAKGNYATSLGFKATATGNYSTAMGASTVANGDYSTAMGNGTKAYADYSTAMGKGTIANGDYSTAMGLFTTANGSVSTAMGSGTVANGSTSTAMGSSTVANGSSSTAMGFLTVANGDNSTAMGHSTEANRSYSTAMGFHTIANIIGSTVIGKYNDSISSRTAGTTNAALLIVGNGDNNSNRSNALVVFENGRVAIGNNRTPVNPLHVTGGSGVTLSDLSGYMTLGSVDITNLVMDNNEIQVRNNGAASDLYLQNKGGNVGIGNTGTPGYQLELSTNSAAKPGSSSWTIPSDSRLKENVKPFNDGLQQLLKIKPVTYNYNQQSGCDTKPVYVGIIAQELKQIAPYMVSTAKKNGSDYLNVDNGAMTYMLINAVKEQQKIIEELKKIAEEFKNRIELLEGRK